MKINECLYVYHYDVDKFMDLWQIAANSLHFQQQQQPPPQKT